MGKELEYEFDYMLANQVCSNVKVFKDGTLQVTDYTPHLVERPFGSWGNEATMEDLYHFYETRCFPKTRYNCKSVLKAGGLDKHDAYQIVLKTQGRMTDDEFWLNFKKGENL